MKTFRKTISAFLCMLLAGCSASRQPASSSAAETPEAEKEIETSEVIPSLSISNQWDSGDDHYVQMNITIENSSDRDIDTWSIRLSLPDQSREDSHWNCELNDDWTLSPVEWNAEIPAGETLQDIGIIAVTDQPDAVTINSTDITYADGTQETIHGIPQKEEVTPVPSTAEPEKPVGKAVGALHVDGNHIVNSSNEIVQLKGVSTHGLAWFPDYVNEDAFRTLHDDWGANVIRLAMYTAESGGYCTDGDHNKLKKLIDTGVKAASKLGMYVIIDWHILSDSSPMQNKDAAIAFFDEMSRKYSKYDNVLYELCNEPQNSPWKTVIKPYAEEVLKTIRNNDKDAICIVGTNTWSQDVDEVIGNTLDDPNVVYTCHFYAGTHKDNLRDKVVKAMNAGVPVFVSECSICDASGNGGIDYDSAQAWLDLLNENQISFIAWSLSNKDETSALIKSSCTKKSGWSDDNLSETGKWFKTAIQG